METKRLIFVILLSMAVVFGWNIFLSEMGKRNNWVNPNQPQTQPVVQPQAAASTNTPVMSGVENPPAGVTGVTGEMRVLNASSITSDALLGSNIKDDPTWAMGLETSGQGASISRITLNEFPRDVKRKATYVFQETPAVGAASMATLWVEINKQHIDLSKARWTLARREPNFCDYTVDIGKDQPLLRIHKIIELTPRNNAKGSPATAGYQVDIRHKVENLSNDVIEAQFGLAGPTMLPREVDRGPDRYVLAAYNDDPQYPTPLLKPVSWDVMTLTGDKQRLNIEKSKEGWPVIWAGMTSTYFDAIVYPVASGDNRVTAGFMSNVQARSVDPSAVAANIQVELLFTTKLLRIEAQKPAEFTMEVFFGPKMRSLVKNDYYGKYPRQFDLTLSTTSSCAWCTFPWLVNAMVMLLRGLHFIVRDWGLAIIGLVLVVRLVLHPLTRKSTISMHKMQKLAPEMERIKKKHADNPAELNRAMMQFYKEHGASQIVGCLPMFLQMPIWVALWSALQGTFELRLAPFLWGFTWIKDLAKPDHLITFPPTRQHCVSCTWPSVSAASKPKPWPRSCSCWLGCPN